MPLSVPGKVFATFVVLLLTFAGVSGFTIWQIRTLGQEVGRLHATLLPLPAVVAELKTDIRALDLVLEQPDGPALSRSVHLARRVQPYLERMREALAQADGRLERVEPAPTAAGVVDRLRALRRIAEPMADAVNAFFDAVESGAETTAPRREARRRIRDLGREINVFEVDLAAAIDLTVAAFVEREARAVWGGIVFATVAMVIGIAATISAGRLLRPLQTLRGAAGRIAAGDYGGRVPEDAPGELGALAAEFNRMAEAIRNRDAQLGAQQKELLHQERLAAVGRMSAQITHELRNPLSSIGLNSELLMEELELASRRFSPATARDRAGDATGPPDDGLADARGLLESIIAEVERLREITEEYLRFARLPRPEPAPVDLNQAVGELLEFLRSELDADHVRARLDPDRHAPPAHVDPNQLRAALLNLIRNAREAIAHSAPNGARNGGHIVVRVRTLGAAEGRGAAIEVIDDGPGIDPAVRERLFEPFFSTKPQGTGLGLSMVRRIAQANGGDIEVDSTPGQGTTVRLLLPLSSEGES